MAATADFQWAYDLVVLDNLRGPEFNAAMTLLEGYINSLKARLDLLDGAVTPADYFTQAEAVTHFANANAHPRMVRLGGHDTLAGVSCPPDISPQVQTKTITLTVATQTFTWGNPTPTPFSRGAGVVVATQYAGAPTAPVSISGITLMGCNITGTIGATYLVLGLGW